MHLEINKNEVDSDDESSVNSSEMWDEMEENEKEYTEMKQKAIKLGFESAVNKKILVSVLITLCIGNFQTNTIPAFLPIFVDGHEWNLN